MGALAGRCAHPGTVFIPGTVRYTVAGYDSAGPDQTDRTRRDHRASAVARAEAHTGITMAAIRAFPGRGCHPRRHRARAARQQDLAAGTQGRDLLIRSTTTTYPLDPPRDVQPGDTAVLSPAAAGATPSPLTI
jgi:hypothetical protein